MGGFFGIVSTKPCIADLFYGVDYHSHLGTKRGGIVTYHKDLKLAASKSNAIERLTRINPKRERFVIDESIFFFEKHFSERAVGRGHVR